MGVFGREIQPMDEEAHSGLCGRQTSILSAVKFIATRLAEYRANRWGERPIVARIRIPSRAPASRPKGADMLAWLLRQLERIERIHAAAGALMSEFGDEGLC